MKFGSKLMYLDYLHQLAQHISLSQLIIPPAVRKSVDVVLSELHEKSPMWVPGLKLVGKCVSR